MKRTLTTIALLVTGLLSLNCVQAQKSAQGGWQELFNGRDLSGWRMLNAPHKVEVRDGMVVATTVPGQDNGFLCTDELYGDFILEMDVKTDLLLDNSGIQFRSLSNPEDRNGRVHGYQVQIENRPPHVSQWSGAIYDEAGRGFLYIIEDDAVRQKAYIQNQWNRVRIEAIGTTLRVWINGIPTAHVVDDKILKGLICLQVHGGAHASERGEQSVYMRNVRIQTESLKPSPFDDIPVANYIPNTLSGQEAHQGFKLLFDGETTKGWRIDTKVSSSTARIENGTITISRTEESENSKPIAVAMTDEQFGPFELKFEFKLHNKNAIAGIEYFHSGKPDAERQALYGRLALDNALHRARVNRDLWKEWNQGVIKAYPDNRVEYWLNGYKILEYIRDSDKPLKGHILLDAYPGDTVSYRSIKIRRLTK